MNIYAQNLSLVRKNMKIGEISANKHLKNSTEPTITNPEDTLKGLEAQAHNNIAFQALNVKNAPAKGLKKFSKLFANKGKYTAETMEQKGFNKSKAAKGLAVLTMVPVVSQTMSSCVDVDQYVDVQVDMEATNALISQMISLLQKLVDGQVITNKALEDLMQEMTRLQDMVNDGLINFAEFQQQLFNYMTTNNELQQAILDQLVANGESQEAANEWLENLITEVREGKTSLADAINMIIALLGSIDTTLKDILEETSRIRENQETYYPQMIDNQRESINLMGDILEQNTQQTALLEEMNQSTTDMQNAIQILVSNSNHLIAIASDTTKFNAMMDKMDSLHVANMNEFNEYKDMFEQFGVNLTELITNNHNDSQAARQTLLNAVNDFKTNYLGNASKQAELLDSINTLLNFVVSYLPNLSTAELEALVRSLINSVNNVTDAIGENGEIVKTKMEQILAKLEQMIGKFDQMLNKMNGFQENFNQQQNNWQATLAGIDSLANNMSEIRRNQQVNNRILQNIRGDINDMKTAQQTSNSYLYILTQQHEQIMDIVDSLNLNVEVNGNGGMTVEEFLEAAEIIKADVANDIEAFITRYGFNNISTLKDLLEAIKDKIDTQKDYSGQLDRIIGLENDILSFLQNADFSSSSDREQLLIIIEILRNFKNNCCNGGNPDNNDEGIEDLEDMFS